MVHTYISVQLSFKTVTFGCTMFTICNDIVSNVWKSEMSHCERNVAYIYNHIYMRFAHNIDFNINFSHNCALNVKAQIYSLEQGLIM